MSVTGTAYRAVLGNFADSPGRTDDPQRRKKTKGRDDYASVVLTARRVSGDMLPIAAAFLPPGHYMTCTVTFAGVLLTRQRWRYKQRTGEE